MRFEGRVWQDGEHWLIEVPALHAMTQGHSESEAYEMMRDLVETMADQPPSWRSRRSRSSRTTGR